MTLVAAVALRLVSLAAKSVGFGRTPCWKMEKTPVIPKPQRGKVMLNTLSLVKVISSCRQRATGGLTNMAEDNNDSSTAAPPSPKKPKLENKVELQKERALALWEKTVASGSVPNDVDESVRAHLDKGEVLPIFHAMVRGGGSPFPFESHSHELSHVNPKKGSAIPKRKDGNNEIPELDLDDPSLDIFFSHDSAEHEVQDHAEPAVQVREDPQVRKAERRVQDGPRIWEFSMKQTENAVALVASAATMIGEDVEVTEGLAHFPILKQTEPTFDLITRRLSRGVVANCFGESEPSSTLAITGSPGIGKSMTLLYALQQALLFENACVIFFLQQRRDAHLYIRRNGCIFAWTSVANDPCAMSTLKNRRDILVLLDPREAAEGGASYVTGSWKVLFAASNNTAHFSNAIFKNQSFPERFLSPWTMEELTVALPKMYRKVSLPLAHERAKVVGMLPRYLMDDGLFVARAKLSDSAVKKLRSSDAEVQSMLGWNGQDSDKRTTVAGTLFAVHAAFRGSCGQGEDFDDQHSGVNEDEVLDGFDEDAGDSSDGEEDLEVGYDGSGIEYRERRLEIMNPGVLESVWKQHRGAILSFWDKPDVEQRIAMGIAVEELFWVDDLERFTAPPPSTGTPFSMKRWKQTGSAYPPVPSDLVGSKQWTKLSDRLGIDGLELIFNSDDQVCRMSVATPTIDFAGPGRKVYQVTVGKNHSMNIDGMIKILIQAGYLREDDKGNAALVRSGAPKEKFEFIWVVPKGIAPGWKNKVPRRVAQTSKRNKALQSCLDAYVEQYVLEMDPKLPLAIESHAYFQSGLCYL
jgi:hypothetical protein